MSETSDATPGPSPVQIDVEGQSVEQIVNTVLDHALSISASDLFFCSNEDYLAVHARALGLVHQLCIVSIEEGRRVVSHIKASAGMDVAEKRRPLDGRWLYETEAGDTVDLRISMIPTMHGEDLALRLLPRETQLFDLKSLGLVKRQYNELTSMLSGAGGMILCTGPTGSGKTSMLYACLRHLNNGQRKINTIEDPIEYAIEGVRHSEIRPKIGVGFSELLRAVLRQGPDVIMIGEIRDAETAQVAVRAANSGLLVLATLHAPVAAGAIQSMRAFGVHPYFLSSALRGVVSQRLVRTLCPHCRTSFDVSHAPHMFDDVKKWLGPGEGEQLFAPRGCDKCQHRGYAGRTGVYELMSINAELRTMIAEEKPTRDIRHKAMEHGMLDFRLAALLKVAQGMTSTEEVFRVLPSEHMTRED